MSSGLTDDDKRRIESFSETPAYDRSPEDLRPDQQYENTHTRGDDGEESLVRFVWQRFYEWATTTVRGRL